MNLHPFQEKTVAKLSTKKRAYLAALMGLGKTAMLLKTLERTQALPALVVCPAVVANHWEQEVKKWVPALAEGIEVVSYEAAVKLSKTKSRKKYETIIFDEAQYLKNPTAIRTKLLLLNKNCLIAGTEWIYFASGTPTPNNVSEIWPALFTIGAVKERFHAFCERYCEFTKVFIGHGRSVTKVSGSFKARMPELKRRCADFVLQISYKEARIDLPEVQFTILPVKGEYYPHYAHTEAEGENAFNVALMPNLTGPQDPFLALQALAPSISSLRKMHAMRKVKACVDLITEELYLGLYEKVVLFAHHKEAITKIHAELQKNKIDAVYVHGEVNPVERFARIKRFQEDPKCQVYIGSILASGVGINLHSTNQVIFLEQSFVPGDNAQSIARAARIGQKEKTVFVRWLTLSDSGVDQRVAEILLAKTDDLKAFYG